MIGKQVYIGPHVIIEDNVIIEDEVKVEAGCFIGENSCIKKKTHISANVTIHHDVLGKDGAGKVLLRSAPSGTGIIAGGAIRAACEVIGIQDIVAKSLGSSNPINVLRACLKGLKNQNSPKQISKIRGKTIAEITKSRSQN